MIAPRHPHPTLPAGISLHRKTDTDSISSVADITLIPGTEGFEAVEHAAPGGDIMLAFFSTDAASEFFETGFDIAGPGDRCSYVAEEIRTPSGSVFALLIHYGDSDDDHTSILDYRR